MEITSNNIKFFSLGRSFHKKNHNYFIPKQKKREYKRYTIKVIAEIQNQESVVYQFGVKKPLQFLNVTVRKNDVHCAFKRFSRSFPVSCFPAQLYTQLAHKPHFGPLIILFVQLRAVLEKKWILVFQSNFWRCFFQFFCGKKKLKNYLKRKFFKSFLKKLWILNWLPLWF